MAMTKHPDPEKVKPSGPAPHQDDAARVDAGEYRTAPGVSVPAVTPHDPGRPVASAGPIVDVSPVVAKALAKDGRDAKPGPAVGPDPHGAPAAAGKSGPGDEAVVVECLNALSKITDAGSLARVLAAVQGRVGVPEKIEPKASGHTV